MQNVQDSHENFIVSIKIVKVIYNYLRENQERLSKAVKNSNN